MGVGREVGVAKVVGVENLVTAETAEGPAGSSLPLLRCHQLPGGLPVSHRRNVLGLQPGQQSKWELWNLLSKLLTSVHKKAAGDLAHSSRPCLPRQLPRTQTPQLGCSSQGVPWVAIVQVEPDADRLISLRIQAVVRFAQVSAVWSGRVRLSR